jgi:galactose-1-phosphate uridylyltransferase
VRITPRLTVTAGFERGTGLFVNVVPPEHAATALRDEPAREGVKP